MVAPAVIGAVGSLAAGGLNYAGAHSANVANRKIAREQMKFQQKSSREQMAFQERMSNTAYQRAMQDMFAAGLNPILAYQQGGASTPTGASASGASIAQQNELSGAVSSAIDVKRAFAEIANLREQNKKLKSDTDISNAEAQLLRAQIPGAEVEKAIDSSRYAPAIRFIQRIIPWVNSAKGVFQILGDNMTKRVQKFFTEPSRTKQEFKNECDINIIMKRFKKVAGVDFLNRYQGVVGGQFGDFSGVSDYRTAIEQVERARSVFMALPAVVRAKFENDPASFLDFVQNPANADEMVKMGLAVSKASLGGVSTPSEPATK